MSRKIQHATSAFTLIELLVVTGIIAILASLLLPSISRAKARALSTQCLSSMNQFALALQLYEEDHNDLLPPNKDGPDVPLGETWVEGWLGNPGPDCTNTLNLQHSLIGRYVPDAKLWRCPAAKDPSVSGERLPRVRTISLNCFIGSLTNAPGRTFHRLTEIAAPSETLAFIEERIDTINDGTFAMDWSFNLNRPKGWILRDKPASQHSGGANLCFTDGHATLQRWNDSRTKSPPRNDALMAGNPDILWLQRHGR